jgi:DNA topoisomerase-1
MSAGPSPVPEANPFALTPAPDLRYTTDADLTWRRRRVGKHFSYVDETGRPIRDTKTLARLKSVAVPPGWTDVRMCPWPDGHIQAIGRDARGRKQYRYHPHWREVRDETKYHRMLRFGQVLPLVRERIDRDLQLPGLPREKVLATVIALLERTHIRVGNQEYARTNHSFGLTTMLSEHVTVGRAKMRFTFRGKSGKMHNVAIDDPRLARVVRQCLHLPGEELFRYLDDDGEPHLVTSADVNAWLREVTGEDFTAKDFRTWAGTVLVAGALEELSLEVDPEGTPRKKDLVNTVKWIAERLGNTPSVCRKCYIHPTILDAYLDGTLRRAMQEQAAADAAAAPGADAGDVGTGGPTTGLQPQEVAVLRLLASHAGEVLVEATAAAARV